MGILDNFRKNKQQDNKQSDSKPEKIEISPKAEILKKNETEEKKEDLKPVICNDAIRSVLDDQQIKAVESPIGNTCVFAIAGAGKTRVLTYRVANLIDNGIPESEMMLLTFTNKAADEMTERIQKILGKKRLHLTSGTFHSIASKFLREYAKELGYKKNFEIITPAVQRSLIDACRNEYLEKYMEGFNNSEFPSKAVIADIYSGTINHNRTFREYIEEFYSYYRNETPDGIILILKDYVARKERDNLMDFDDLLLNFMDILSIDHIREKINKQFKYIFIDEYQDINWMQYKILEYLNHNDTMFVIGDTKQCIYQFRGSKPEYIDIFKNTHRNVFDYSLTYNYRSTPEILMVAEDVISHNDYENRIHMITKNEEGEYPLFFGCDNEIKESEKIADIIIENNLKLKDTAILVRRGAQIAIIEQVMKQRKIPYNLIGSISVFETEHIQDIIAFLQLIDDPTNEAAFNKVAILFAGIGSVNAGYMYKKLQVNKFNYTVTEKITTGRQTYAFSTINKIVNAEYKSVYEMIRNIVRTYYNTYAMNKFPDYTDRMEDMKYFLKQSEEYDNLTDFLDDIITMRKEDKRNDNNDCLTIITMHKAKGLEWDNVFIPFVDKGEYPRCKDKEFLQNTENIKNERNLFYVAITRARKMLYISYSLYYTDKPAGPSPFLEEIDEDLYEADFFKEENKVE